MQDDVTQPTRAHFCIGTKKGFYVFSLPYFKKILFSNFLAFRAHEINVEIETQRMMQLIFL